MKMHLRPLRLGSLLFALMIANSSVRADLDAIDIDLEDLVAVRLLSMPKFAENADQIPSAVSILKREDIRLYGWRTLGDALRSLQGFNVTTDHIYTYAGVRGISPPGDYRPRLQILIDGVASNDNIYASAPLDSSFPLDLGLVERIEVVRGPSAAVYGGDAMFGVINVVTRSGSSLGGTEAAVSYASGKEKRGRVSWGGTVADADVLVSATRGASRGRQLAFMDVNADGVSQSAGGIGGDDLTQLFLRARGTDWRFTLVHADRERIVPTSAYGTIFNDQGHVETDGYSLVDFARDWHFGNKLALHQRLYFGEYRYDALFPYDYSAETPSDPLVINRDVARGNWWGLENRLVSSAVAGQRWTLGLEYRADTRQYQLNDDLGYGCFGQGSAPCLNDNRQRRQVTAYLQDEIQIGAASSLTLGLRYDQVSTDGGFWSPRIGFVHDAEQYGIFKFLYGTAFRTPSVYERYYSPVSYPYGNPAVRSEKMRSYEASWEKRFGKAQRLTTTLYTFDVEHLTGSDNNGLAANGSPLRASGLEVEYEQQWSNGSRLRTGFSTQRTRVENGSMDNSPRHMAKMNLAVPTGLAAVMAGFEAQWVSQRQANAGASSVGDYLLANLNLSHAPVGQPWELSLGVYNLFDRRYRDPAAIDGYLPITRWYMPQLGRSLMLHGVFRF